VTSAKTGSSKVESFRGAATAGTTGPISATDPTPARAGLALRWVHPERAQPSVHLSRSAYAVGRDADNDIVISGSAASRRHARIEKRGGALAVLDLGSKNGVFVDGARVNVAPLVPGALLRVGDWVAIVHESAGQAGDSVRELFGGMVGSAALGRALDVARLAAPSGLPILIGGETGTGKELVARAVHAASGRRGEFVAVNCAALTESLLDAELFGHERGAFTGADRARDGWVRQADGGTLFLDEIGELSPSGQAKLLRALEQREVTPVGSSRGVPVDLRVVAATHRDLARLVSENGFRADLYARLEGATVQLPPLSGRRQDIMELFLRFAESALGRPSPRLSSRFVERLLWYDWPRNVRELRHVAEKMAVLCAGEPEWRRRHLSELLPVSAARPAVVPSPLEAPGTHERDVKAALAACGGNVSSAARRLGVSKQSVYRWITAHGIELEELRARTRRRN
jgi:DNA-binding NtrC family response regulator